MPKSTTRQANRLFEPSGILLSTYAYNLKGKLFEPSEILPQALEDTGQGVGSRTGGRKD